MNAKFTPKQQRFVAEYLIDLNATQAAIRAGYSRNCAGQIGEENLKKPQIAEAVARAKRQRSEATKIKVRSCSMSSSRSSGHPFILRLSMPIAPGVLAGPQPTSKIRIPSNSDKSRDLTRFGLGSNRIDIP